MHLCFDQADSSCGSSVKKTPALQALMIVKPILLVVKCTHTIFRPI